MTLTRLRESTTLPVQWSPEEVRDAEVWMEEAVCPHSPHSVESSHQLTDAGTSDGTTAQRKSDQAMSSAASTLRSVPAVGRASSSSQALSAQAKGFANLSELGVSRRVVSLSSTLCFSSRTPSASSAPLPLMPIISTLVGLPQPVPTLTDQGRASCTRKRGARFSAVVGCE